MKEKLNGFGKNMFFLMKLGFKYKMIGGYSDAFLERLRDVYYGGIPASIILLDPARCRRRCYDRVVLADAGLKDMDYRVVYADIDSIRYNKATMDEVKHTYLPNLD